MPELFRRTLALAALTMAGGGVLAATPATGIDPAQPRELLQPPRKFIASPITDRWALRGIYQQPGVNTALRYDSSVLLQGTELSGEGDLGWDHTLNQGNFEMMVRMLERHRLRVDFFDLDRGGDQVISRTVRFGDNLYVASDRVVSDSQLRFIGLTYTYSFLHGDNYELGAGLGVHLFQIDGHAAVPSRRLEERFDAAGPFPTIAVDGTYLMSDRFSLNARVQSFNVNIQDIEGSFTVWHADLQYRPWKALAFGVGYTKTSFDVLSNDDGFAGRLFLDVKGPEAFVRVSL